MIDIKAEIESKIFILLIVSIVAVMFGSIASIFIHLDGFFENDEDGVSSLVSNDSDYNYSNSSYGYNSSSNYNSDYNYNSNSKYNNSYDNNENETLSDKIKEYLNIFLNNDDK